MCVLLKTTSREGSKKIGSKEIGRSQKNWITLNSGQTWKITLADM